MIMLSFLLGCKSFPAKESSQDAEFILDNARLEIEDDLYSAKSRVRSVLSKDPENAQAMELMAEIIDREISAAKAQEDTQSYEDIPDSQKRDQVRTWIERSKTLLEIKQYDEAALAAERVFLYEPNHRGASALLDEIKKAAIREGKEQSIVLKKMYQDEIEIRTALYQEQALQWVKAGRYGAARLAVEKLLLLDPENKQALELYETIKHRIKG